MSDRDEGIRITLGCAFAGGAAVTFAVLDIGTALGVDVPTALPPVLRGAADATVACLGVCFVVLAGLVARVNA